VDHEVARIDNQAAVPAVTTVRAVVRDVVAAVAAEELPLVDELARFDDDTVVGRLVSKRERADPLGFGWGEIAALVTPVVWLTVDQAARRIGTAAGNGAATGMKAVWHRVRGRHAAPRTIVPLTGEQLAQVHEQITTAAARKGLSARRATEIADAVVTRLAVVKPDERPIRSTESSADPDAGHASEKARTTG
jgi:hypothetical protein